MFQQLQMQLQTLEWVKLPLTKWPTNSAHAFNRLPVSMETFPHMFMDYRWVKSKQWSYLTHPRESICVNPTETNPQFRNASQNIDQVVEGSRLVYKAVQDPIGAGNNYNSMALKQVMKINK